MKLSTRLVLLILVCLLPMLAAQVYSQKNLKQDQQADVSELLLRHTTLANADVAGLIDAVAQLGAVVAAVPDILASHQNCGERAASLRNNLAQYRFLAFYGSSGRLLCGSPMAPVGLADGPSRWMTDLATMHGARVGPLVSVDDPAAPFLPVGVQIFNSATGSDPAILVAGIDAKWLAQRLDTTRLDHAGAIGRTTLMIVDRAGVVVARSPASDNAIGRALPSWERLPVEHASGGVETVTDPAGNAFIAAYLPVAPAASGLTVIEIMALPDAIADVDRATYRNLLVIGAAALVALILAWIAGHRFIYQPTEALLQAARKWREGDLGARAPQSSAGSEFSALGQSFNSMAASLQTREMERKLQSGFLAAQVAERTRELSESNNRLQVEIAGREKTEAALHQAQKLQAVGQLAGGIAHDFNNMLATVLGNLELMERRVLQTEREWTPADTERLSRLIARATGAVQRGTQLTSRLLAFSRRQRLAARPTDVNALLRELISLAGSTLGRGVQVVPELAEALWPAMVDPSQIEAALLGLCLNARDAMPQGGCLTISTANVTLSAGATENDPPAGNFIRICITDTGVGMTAEVKARAFDPFFTTKGPRGSPGLGLSQVYGMARQAGGNAVIDSTPGEGTRVTLFLPRATPDEPRQTIQADKSASRINEPARADLVLVVDDDAAVRQVTVEMARDLGCEVVQAADAAQALALLQTMSPAPRLILLDYAMPGMNGLQLAEVLRERGITAPVALVTGYAELSEADIAGAQLAGLLRKPFTIGELHSLLVQLRAVAAEPSPEACFEPGLIES